MSLGLQAGETAGASASLGPAAMLLWLLSGALTPNCHNGLGEAFAQWLVRCEAGVCTAQPCLSYDPQTVGLPGIGQEDRCLAPPVTIHALVYALVHAVGRHITGDTRSPRDAVLGTR